MVDRQGADRIGLVRAAAVDPLGAAVVAVHVARLVLPFLIRAGVELAVADGQGHHVPGVARPAAVGPCLVHPAGVDAEREIPIVRLRGGHAGIVQQAQRHPGPGRRVVLAEDVAQHVAQFRFGVDSRRRWRSPACRGSRAFVTGTSMKSSIPSNRAPSACRQVHAVVHAMVALAGVVAAVAGEFPVPYQAGLRVAQTRTAQDARHSETVDGPCNHGSTLWYWLNPSPCSVPLSRLVVGSQGLDASSPLRARSRMQRRPIIVSLRAYIRARMPHRCNRGTTISRRSPRSVTGSGNCGETVGVRGPSTASLAGQPGPAMYLACRIVLPPKSPLDNRR